jgi:hypothetical protein
MNESQINGAVLVPIPFGAGGRMGRPDDALKGSE